MAGRIVELGAPLAGVAAHPLPAVACAFEPEAEVVNPRPSTATRVQPTGPLVEDWFRIPWAPSEATWL